MRFNYFASGACSIGTLYALTAGMYWWALLDAIFAVLNWWIADKGEDFS